LKAFQPYRARSVSGEDADSPARRRAALARGRGEPLTEELEAALADAELTDEFGRALPAPIDVSFMTSHRPPAYTLQHPVGVLEQGVDSEIPLYVQNLESYTLTYGTLTRAGTQSSQERTVKLPDVEDVQFGVPLHVREILGGHAGLVFGTLSVEPTV